MSDHERAPKSLLSLQMGRGIAALAVAAFHLAIIIPTSSSILSRFAEHGNAGVDFFFILSGFIMMHAHQRDGSKPAEISRYFQKRFVRIYPLYWIITAGTLVVAMVAPGKNHVTIPHDILNWIECVFLIRIDNAGMPIVASWTLYYEVIFYGIFSIYLLSERASLVVFILWAVVILVFHRRFENTDPVGPFLSTLSANFILGVLSHYIYNNIGRVGAFSCLVSGVIIVILLGFFSPQISSGWFSIALTLSFVLLVSGASGVEKFQAVSVGFYGLLGDASYTIYLAHGHVEPVVVNFLSKLFHAMNDFVFITSFALTVLICLIIHFLVERPTIRAAKYAMKSVNLSFRLRKVSQHRVKL